MQRSIRHSGIGFPLAVKGGASAPNGAPSGLTLTVVATNEIDLTYSSSSTNQDGYRIYMSSNGGVSYSEKGTSVGLTYNATGLTAGATYYFYVVAYKGTKESALSNIAHDATIPNPDALFDTRTGLNITDSVGGLTASLKDFPIFHQKNAIDATASGVSTYIAPDTGDLTAVIFIKPAQGTTNYTDIKGFGGYSNNYFRIYHLDKLVRGYLNGTLISASISTPDSANYLTNVYMLVYKYVQSAGTAYIRCYNTSTNYVEKTKTAALPASNSTPLTFNMTASGAECGLILSLYYTAELSDAQLTALWNGTIPSTDLTSLISFTSGEGIRAYIYDSIANGQFEFQDSHGHVPVSPYYDILLPNVHAAYPLIYGFTRRSLQDLVYNASSTKIITALPGDVEYPASSCIWNMANGRLYFNTITDATIKAIFDKSNSTYWKASIQSESDYVDAGGGYYGVWAAEQLQRDFIEIHAQSGHENHIYASLRTSGAVVTGITAIRIYKTNLT